ncbi:hypothetical protein [Myxococcus landrumensis]|uniref:Lipoprotein n=1 Tax=Myxococcus landrumensis TaxID=2813577 RepID=A0ABX7N1T2_9BACT|nr:hypothetical protein [Myxococcus landrumus]QSQ12456.1 hypothetical protein JY572_29425 [Myxococcus landrumus]
MKTLITTLALCLGTAALAQSEPEKAPSQTQVPGPSTRVHTGVNAADVGRGINGGKKEAEKVPGHDNTYNKKDALSLKGTLKEADDDSVSMTRKNLPDAKLEVKDQTVVLLDGKKVRADEIPEGSELKVRFQLDGDNIVAVEVRATSPKGTGGSGKDTKKDKDAKPVDEDVKKDLNDGTH